MKRIYFGLFIWMTFISCGLNECDEGKRAATGGSEARFSIVNWNVQTFFDGKTDGKEYKEYKSSEKWSNDKYIARLTRLCDVLTSINADICVLEEIENEGVIYDISNQLAGKSWDSRNNWNYSCFSKEEESSIGCAVLSRFPLFGIKSHSIDIRSQSKKQPSVRPLMEVSADVNRQEVTIFVNHWKSKSGGEYESEIWRDWQESVLAGRLEALRARGGRAVICGDFNRDADEFILDFSGGKDSANTIFRNASLSGSPSHVKARSPWFKADGGYATPIGSYFYKGSWERIDHIFTLGQARFISFAPKAEEPWADQDKIPVAYKIYSGSGYSDHLPVLANILLY